MLAAKFAVARLRYVAAGSAFTLLMILGLATRWRIFLRSQAINVPFRPILCLTWAGQCFNSLLPGSTGGDVVKLVQICRAEPTRRAAAASTVVADRLSALLALVCLAGWGIVVAPGPLRLLADVKISRSIIVAAVLAAVAGALVILLCVRRSSHWLQRAQSVLLECRRAFGLATMAPATFLAVGVHLVNFLVIYLFCVALRIDLSYREVVAMMAVVLFVLLVPITINGHGIREVLLISYLTFFGARSGATDTSLAKDAAVALSITMVANDLVCSLPGGLWYLLRFGRIPTAQSKS